jgi:uncharacterized protein
MPLHENFTQTVGTESLAATITRPNNQPNAQPTILLVHGAGGSNSSRFAPLAEYLAHHGHTSLCFDHSGHGESTGQLANSSLTKRMEEILAFMPLLDASQPLTVMGSSMGAHSACRLLEHLPVATLITQVPAAYAAHAEDIPFGEAFTAALKKPNSWQDALIWPQLKSFTGNFLLISGGKDTVIPPEVIRSYWHHAHNAHKRTHFYMPEAEHKFTSWLDEHSGNRGAYFRSILNVLPQ